MPPRPSSARPSWLAYSNAALFVPHVWSAVRSNWQRRCRTSSMAWKNPHTRRPRAYYNRQLPWPCPKSHTGQSSQHQGHLAHTVCVCLCTADAPTTALPSSQRLVAPHMLQCSRSALSPALPAATQSCKPYPVPHRCPRPPPTGPSILRLGRMYGEYSRPWLVPGCCTTQQQHWQPGVPHTLEPQCTVPVPRPAVGSDSRPRPSRYTPAYRRR